MMRILLFLATNAAVLVLISIVFQVLGIEGILAENGVDLNLQALLVMSAVIGFGGSFISLALSKFMAKRSMGVQLIEQPRNRDEQWLLDTVKDLADEAGIGVGDGELVSVRGAFRQDAALDKLGLSDDTIVIFSSDQGIAIGSHGLMGKQNQYDHSVRMPMIFCGPGVKAPCHSAPGRDCY